MQDREPTYPGRVTLTPVYGLANTYDMERADRPLQEGTPLNKASLLKDSTAALLGLGTSAVPDDAFLALAIGVGTYGFRVKVQLPDGTPVAGANVTGITALPGASLTTNSDGIVVGSSSAASVTIGVSSPFVDLKAPDSQNVTATGTLTDVTFVLSYNTDVIQVTSSRVIDNISPFAKSVDVTAIGGGGGGGGARSYQNSPRVYAALGGGGGGGYATTRLSIALSTGSKITLVVGAGGTSAANQSGTAGGKTTVTIGNTTVSAAGGSGGYLYTGEDFGNADLNLGEGGAGNGNGGKGGSPGSPSTARIFNDTSLDLAGGGGGGGGGLKSTSTSPAGGAPNGGSGVKYRSDPLNENIGRAFGGGGGGGSVYTNASGDQANAGAAGGAGGVYLRFNFDAA